MVALWVGLRVAKKVGQTVVERVGRSVFSMAVNLERTLAAWTVEKLVVRRVGQSEPMSAGKWVAKTVERRAIQLAALKVEM
jgi:hypothetical protein